MRFTGIAVAYLLCCLLDGVASLAADLPPVDLEVIVSSGSSAITAHEWAQTLQTLPLESVRVHSERGRDTAEVIPVGEGASRRFQVIGVIDSQNRLVVPGGKFRSSEMSRFRTWLEALDRQPGTVDAVGAYGLTAQQLIELTERLAIPFPDETKGQSVKAVLTRMQRLIEPKLRLDGSARNVIQSDDLVHEELQGVSVGTAVAAILRPLGLVMRPQLANRHASGGEAALTIFDVQQTKENWPVGWPRPNNPSELVAKWMEPVEIAIDDVALSETLQVLQSRMEVPFLLDQNGMARQRIDPDKVRVSHPEKRVPYGRILRRLLLQAKLKLEVRADEAGHPFVWITPTRSK